MDLHNLRKSKSVTLCPALPITINPAFVPHSTCTCEMRFTDIYGLNVYEGTKTTNSLHLLERYSAEFKQTIEMNEHSLPETVFATFEFSGVCNLMQNTAQ